jgi:hypothetical protein
VGHRLQLLAFLTFLEEERRKDALGALFRSGTKGKREVKNLECSVNYDARGVLSSRGKRKMRGHTNNFMKPKILSWNVRGLNERSKCLRISNLIRDWKVDIVCFQETKLHGLSRRIVRSLWGCSHVD